MVFDQMELGTGSARDGLCGGVISKRRCAMGKHKEELDHGEFEDDQLGLGCSGGKATALVSARIAKVSRDCLWRPC